MSRYVTVNKNVEVDIYLVDIDTADLIEELQRRGCNVNGMGRGIEPQCLDQLREAVIFQNKPKMMDLIGDIIYQGLGKIL